MRAPSVWPSAHVRWLDCEDEFLLLDLQAGRYLVLDQPLAGAWRDHVVGTSPVDAPSRRLVEPLVDRGLAGWREPEAAAPPRPVPSRKRPTTTGALRRLRAAARDLECSFALAYRRCDLQVALPAAAPHTLRTATRVFMRAEALRGRVDASLDCLPRSLALHAFLRGCGLGSTHVMGVRRYPFGAHAWVELEGRPVLDDPAVVAGFRPLSVLGEPPSPSGAAR